MKTGIPSELWCSGLCTCLGHILVVGSQGTKSVLSLLSKSEALKMNKIQKSAMLKRNFIIVEAVTFKILFCTFFPRQLCSKSDSFQMANKKYITQNKLLL